MLPHQENKNTKRRSQVQQSNQFLCLQGSLTVDLLPYQKRGLAWMLHREQAAGKPAVSGGLLADDQGLGKTVTTIALLLSHPPSQVCRCSSAWPSACTGLPLLFFLATRMHRFAITLLFGPNTCIGLPLLCFLATHLHGFAVAPLFGQTTCTALPSLFCSVCHNSYA